MDARSTPRTLQIERVLGQEGGGATVVSLIPLSNLRFFDLRALLRWFACARAAQGARRWSLAVRRRVMEPSAKKRRDPTRRWHDETILSVPFSHGSLAFYGGLCNGTRTASCLLDRSPS